MTARRRRLWMAIGAVLLAGVASSYFWWWKPVVLASIRMALEGSLAKNLPAASFGSLDLAGIQTVVVRDLSYGKPQDDFSVVVPEARFTFSFWHLATGKFDPVASLKSVVLVSPQAILTLEAMGNGPEKPGKKPAAKPSPSLAIPLPAQAQMGMKNGRILLRSRAEKSRFVSFSDMDGELILPERGTALFNAKFTSPDSPRRGVSAEGVLTPSGLSASLTLRKLRLTPLSAWIKRFDPPVVPVVGALSCDVTFSATRTASAGWRISKSGGRIEADGIGVSGRALPFRLREITGTVKLDGNTARIGSLSLLAPETKWKLSGSLDNFTGPVLHITAEAPSFDLAQYRKGAEGRGTITLSAEGPVTNPSIIIRPDLANFRLDSFSCARIRGRYTVEGRGKSVLLEPGIISLGAGEISAWGPLEPGTPGATLRWTFTPTAGETMAWAGTAALARNVLTLTAKSADGNWVVTGRSRRESGAWNTSLGAHSGSGGSISANVRAGTKPPFNLSGTVSVREATLAGLYISGAWETLARVKGRFNASGQLSGTASNPALSLALDGRGLTLDGEKLGATGTLKLTAESARLDPVNIGEYASITVQIPLGNGRVQVNGSATGLPIPLALAIAGTPPEWRANAGGTIQGKFSAENPGKDGGTFLANLELRELAWKEARLGTGAVVASGNGSSIRFSKIRLNGPTASANGSGKLELLPGGSWDAELPLTVNYLKKGLSDLDCTAKLTASSRPKELNLGALLSAVRISGTPYPDAEISLKQGDDGSSTVKLSWEDLAYISATFKDSPEKSLALSAALSDFPVAPAMGLFSLPAPADRVSGSVSLKGPRNHSTLSASLKWGHGDADVRGWVDSASGKYLSVSMTAVDGNLKPWVAFIRTFHRTRNIPELDGRLETRGMTVEKDGDAVYANGWVGAKELRVGGVLCGNGSFRLTSSRDRAEFEASLDGPQGKYTLYPTKIEIDGERRTMKGAVAWSGMPLAKAQCSLARAEIGAAWTDSAATANILLTGLALENGVLDKTSIRLDRKGDKWRVSSPKDSPWQAIGTITLAGTKVTVEEDERTGAASILIRGGDETSLKVGGTWAPPAAPEVFSLEAHRLPAAPLFAALGMPPAEGLAEADLAWKADATPPLTGQLTLAGTRWGGFPLDSVDAKISGTPGRSFTMSSLRLVKGTDLAVRGTGELILFPEQSIKLEVVVEKMVLRYLKPLGLLDDSDSTARGKLSVTGTPDQPQLDGTLTCQPGTVNPRTGFSLLYLTEGKLDFTGKRATLKATLNDIAGSSVLVNGAAEMDKLMPKSFTLALSVPQPIKVDDLPGLYRGTARGEVKFEGTPEDPVLRGEVTLENGQLKTPPAAKKGGKESFTDRMTWDMQVGFGKGVQYVIAAPLGGEITLAQLSPKSLVTIKGKGADFKVAGEVLGESGPLTLFLGQRLWRR